MPFYLYDVTETPTEKKHTLVRQVSIAGNGPLFAIHNSKNPTRKTPFPWHASSAEIVQATGGNPTQEIIIDLKPNIPNNVSLYRLVDVWGFSYDNWTPLAIRLEAIFSDRYELNPSEFKASFVEQVGKPEFVGEFLYVQGGVTNGTWNWGQVGSVNGALLWPDAFFFLSGQLAKALQEAS